MVSILTETSTPNVGGGHEKSTCCCRGELRAKIEQVNNL